METCELGEYFKYASLKPAVFLLQRRQERASWQQCGFRIHSTGSSDNSTDLPFEFNNDYFSVPPQSPLLNFSHISKSFNESEMLKSPNDAKNE